MFSGFTIFWRALTTRRSHPPRSDFITNQYINFFSMNCSLHHSIVWMLFVEIYITQKWMKMRKKKSIDENKPMLEEILPWLYSTMGAKTT